MTYKVLGNSRRVEKDFLKIINGFSQEEQSSIWQVLLNDQKGDTSSHWTIKKVYKDIWQLDLPRGYRLEYTVLDKERFVLVRFIGSHDDAAVFLRTKQYLRRVGETNTQKHMTNKMAVVRITSYTRNRAAAKASIRYITHRPRADGSAASRPLYTIDGQVTKLDAYQMIDEARKGSVFFRIVISPDPDKEDTSQDLYLWQITEQTMLTLEERLQTEVPFVAAEHNDHTGNRHVHLLACAKARIEKPDLKALRDSATNAALLQRQERDQVLQEKRRAVEEVYSGHISCQQAACFQLSCCF